MPEYIALSGAAVAAMALGWTLWRHVWDRGRIRVQAKVPTDATFGQAVIGDQLVFEVTNPGKQPVWVKEVGLIARGKPYGLALDPSGGSVASLPTRLDAGQKLLIRTVLPSEPLAMKRFCVWDTLGKRYCAPVAQVREVQKLLRGDR